MAERPDDAAAGGADRSTGHHGVHHGPPDDVQHGRSGGGPASAALEWDARYLSRVKRWSGNPNPGLVEHAAALAPGRALDLGCGEGADALWLARRGWAVTALDVSAVALDRAAEHASADPAGHRITWLHADLGSWQPDAAYDLVSAQFLHSTSLPWLVPLRTAAAAVGPGGMLLVVGHHPEKLPPWATQLDPASLFTAEQLMAELGIAGPRWRVEVAASTERSATGPDGQAAILADAVLRAVRL